MNRFIFTLVTTMLLVTAVSLCCYGQGGASSSLTGTVIDQSGAVIPGAEVTVKNNATGAEAKTVTAANGTFSIPALSPGTYRATITMPGFKQSVVENIVLVAAAPSTIRVTLQVGGSDQTVTVVAGADVLQTQTANITTTLVLRQVSNLPLATRNAMDFLIFLPGVNTTGGTRNSDVVGLSGAAINITIDGVNTQDNYGKSGDGFFTMLQARLDAIEEVTISTATPGSESAGQGAVQIKFVTRSGNNDFRGSAYWYHRNPALNSNYWFNNRDLTPTYNGTRTPCTAQQLTNEWDKCKAPRDRVLFNQPGFRLGGPITPPKALFGPLAFSGRDKAFFFVDYEEYRLPSQATRLRTVFNPLVDQGIFPYRGAGGVTKQVNLLQLAAANGQTSTMDPTIQKLLADIRQSTSKGTLIQQTDPAYMDFKFTNRALDIRKFITSRLDFNLTSRHRLEGSWNYSIYDLTIDLLNSGDPSYPDFPSINGYLGLRFSTAIALRSTLTSRLVNEARAGMQGGPGLFGPEVNAGMFSGSLANQEGYSLGISAAGIDNAYRSTSPSRRTPPYTLFEDTLNWSKGSHSLSFGASFSNTGMWTWSQTVVPSIGFGVDTNYDPARSMFDAQHYPTNFPEIASGDVGTARSIYAVLTGRVTSIGGNAVLNEETLKYAYNGPRVARAHQRELGFFVQDSWRMRPNLTLTYGLRYELQLPFVPLNDVFSRSTIADVWGPSGAASLFKPGATGGKETEYLLYKKGDPAYNINYKAFAPSFGFAWSPKVTGGWLGRLLGSSGQTVFRGGYSIAYNRYGMSTYAGIFTSNPGQTLTASRNMTLGNLVTNVGTDVLPVLFREKNRLSPPPFADAPTYPLKPTISDSVRAFDPNLRTPYTMSWSFGLQRELTRDMVLEVRYVATRNLQPYYTYNLNERNIVENGFLGEFKLAMANLQANIAAGRGNTFKYAGPGTGTSPLPITLAYFSGIAASQAGDATKYTSSNFVSTTYVNTLARTNPNPGSYAGSLYGDATRRANALAAGLSANLFVVNPYVSSNQITGNGGQNMYDSMMMEVRRRMAKGLLVQANYTFAKSLGTGSPSFRSPWVKTRGSTLPHAFKINWVYEMPFGRGRMIFNNTHGVIDRIIGGWEFQGAGRIQAGNQLNFGNVRLVGMTLDELRDAAGLRFVDASRLLYYLPDDVIQNTIKAFSTSAITSTGYGSYGVPTGRYVAPANTADCVQIYNGQCAPYTNYIRGPGFARFDLSLVKRIRFTESKNFELRAEFLNAFNNINFYGVTCTSSSLTCGQVTSAYTDAREQVDPGGRLVQLVMRINF